MGEHKLGVSSDGRPLHYSVGALITKGGRYLLLDRVRKPFGFAGVAGHVEEGETPIEAIEREVKEESDLTSVTCQILFDEEVLWNGCSHGDFTHHWYLFKIDVEGMFFKLNAHAGKVMGWYTPEELAELNLEPVWRYWFERLKIIKKKDAALSETFGKEKITRKTEDILKEIDEEGWSD